VIVICLHACEEDSGRESVQPQPASEPNTSASDEQSDSPLIVEERLLACLDALKCLQYLARLAQQPNNIPQFSSLFTFARTANRLARAIAEHLKAIQLALPTAATDLQAPGRKEPV
jgi:hypothetical protein